MLRHLFRCNVNRESRSVTLHDANIHAQHITACIEYPRPQEFKAEDNEDEPTVVLRFKRDGKSQFPASHCLGEAP